MCNCPFIGFADHHPEAMPPKSSISAATDINIGMKALGLPLSNRIESGYWFMRTPSKPSRGCDYLVNLSLLTLRCKVAHRNASIANPHQGSMPFDLITRTVERSVRNLSRALAASGAEAFVAMPPSK